MQVLETSCSSWYNIYEVIKMARPPEAQIRVEKEFGKSVKRINARILY